MAHGRRLSPCFLGLGPGVLSLPSPLPKPRKPDADAFLLARDAREFLDNALNYSTFMPIQI